MKLEDRVTTPPGLFEQERKGRFLVVEPTRLKWAVLDPDLKPKFDFFRDTKTIGEASSLGISEAEIETLHDAGLLVVNGQYKHNHDFTSENASKGLSLVVLHTSNACNFRCTYCYPDAATGKSMQMKVAKKTIERTAEHSDEPIKLEFHGGEPLIHYRFIKQVVEYADQFRRKDGSKKFYFTMQTNASLLDEEKVDFLAKHNFRVGTSLDGLSEFNDKTRVYGNGKSTFEDTLRGIRLLQERKVPFGTIRVISNVSAVDRVRDFMLETGIRSLKLNPYFNQGRGTLVMPVQRLQRQYAYKTLELVDRLIEHNEGTDEKLRLGNVSIMLKNLMTSERAYMCMRSPCGAGTSMLGVDIDGSVYPCEEMTGKKDLIIGNVLYNTIGEMVHIPLVQLLKSRRPEDREDCGSCEVRNACEVSCANRSHNMTKGFYAKSEMCGYYKIMFPELMWRVSDNPEGMLKLI